MLHGFMTSSNTADGQHPRGRPRITQFPSRCLACLCAFMQVHYSVINIIVGVKVLYEKEKEMRQGSELADLTGTVSFFGTSMGATRAI